MNNDYMIAGIFVGILLSMFAAAVITSTLPNYERVDTIHEPYLEITIKEGIADTTFVYKFE